MYQFLSKKVHNKKGFTLIELIVVIAILGILAAILIPKFTGFQDKAKQSQALVEAKQWATAADAFLVEKGAVVAADVDTISATAGTPLGNVVLGTVDTDNGHVYFTYTTVADASGKQYQAVRNDGTVAGTIEGTYTLSNVE